MNHIHFGVLAYDYQVIDTAGLTDILTSADKRALQAISRYGPIPQEVIDRAPTFTFHHIGITKEPVALGTSGMTIVPTTTVDECPDLDILLVPGPFLGNGFQPHPKHADLIRRHVASGKLLFTSCTGASVAASTGALDGRTATVNNVEFEWVKGRWPAVNWTREKKWVIDGNVWTGSGAVAAMDMVAFWVKENYGLDVLIQGSRPLDYEPRDENGLHTVFPHRFDDEGRQLPTHVFVYH